MAEVQTEIRRLQAERKSGEEKFNFDGNEDERNDRVALMSRGQFDANLYGETDKGNYVSSLPTEEEELLMEEEEPQASHPSTRARINPSRNLIDDSLGSDGGADIAANYKEQYGSGIVNTRISDRETEVFLNNRCSDRLTKFCIL